MASTVPYHGYNFAKYFFLIFRLDMVFSLSNTYYQRVDVCFPLQNLKFYPKMAILWRRRLKNNQFFFIPKNGNILLKLTFHIFQGAHSLFKLFELYQNLQQKNKHTHFQGSKMAIFGPFFDHFWLLTALRPSARLGTAIISFFYLFSVATIPRPNFQAMAEIWSLWDDLEIFTL